MEERLTFKFSALECALITYGVGMLKKEFINEVEKCQNEGMTPKGAANELEKKYPPEVIALLVSDVDRDILIQIRDIVIRSMQGYPGAGDRVHDAGEPPEKSVFSYVETEAEPEPEPEEDLRHYQ